MTSCIVVFKSKKKKHMSNQPFLQLEAKFVLHFRYCKVLCSFFLFLYDKINKLKIYFVLFNLFSTKRLKESKVLYTSEGLLVARKAKKFSISYLFFSLLFLLYSEIHLVIFIICLKQFFSLALRKHSFSFSEIKVILKTGWYFKHHALIQLHKRWVSSAARNA